MSNKSNKEKVKIQDGDAGPNSESTPKAKRKNNKHSFSLTHISSKSK